METTYPQPAPRPAATPGNLTADQLRRMALAYDSRFAYAPRPPRKYHG